MVVLFSSYLCSLIFVGRVVLFFFGLVALGILIYCSVGKSGKLVAKLCLKGRGCITTTQIHIISFAYGLYSNSYRRRMWENLSSLAGSQNLPWMITRAASALQIEDRLGGRDPSPYDIRDFSSFCQEMEVTDLNAIGSRFTWSNSSITNPVWSKIDRAMGNSAWFLSHIDSMANFLPPGSLSDHSACVISVHIPEARPKSNFNSTCGLIMQSLFLWCKRFGTEVFMGLSSTNFVRG